MKRKTGNGAASVADARLERWLGRTLGWGTILAAVLLALGLVFSVAGVDTGVPSSLAQVGLIVLMATPVARVVLSVVEYARQRDWAFVALTLTVLGMLVVSFMIAS